MDSEWDEKLLAVHLSLAGPFIAADSEYSEQKYVPQRYVCFWCLLHKINVCLAN